MKHAAETTGRPAQSTMKKKILIIDDEEMIRKFLTDILTHTGYDALSAANGAVAISTLEESPVDLIVLDMNMPQMDGLEFLTYIREHRLTHAPVLMLTGIYDKDKMLECYKLGVYDFIKKPEQLEIMLKRIENGLKIGEMIHFTEFMRVELDAARKLQKYLYPEPVLSTGVAEIKVHMRLLSDIGGDLYDYINFMDGRIIFFVADVSGHSISAALYTAMFKMVFRKAIKETTVPGEILAMLNEEISENLPVESFVTMFCGLLDPDGPTLHFSNGGHPTPIILSGGSVSPLEGHDSFLGPIRHAKFTTYTSDLARVDGLFVYTDGLLDLADPSGVLGSEESLNRCLREQTLTVQQKFECIRGIIEHRETVITDDCTLMMIDFSRRTRT